MQPFGKTLSELRAGGGQQPPGKSSSSRSYLEKTFFRPAAPSEKWLRRSMRRKAIDRAGAWVAGPSLLVARDAVSGMVEEGRTVRLRLANGLEVPVARNRVAVLRSEGWLNREGVQGAPS